MLRRVGVLTLCLAAICIVADGEEKKPARVRKPEPPPLTCNISSYYSTCELGQAPIVQVTLANWTQKDIYLVGSLDGSSSKMRYPYCYFDVIGPDGKTAHGRGGRCGNTGELKEQDFVPIAAGGRFNPHQDNAEHHFFAPRLRPSVFATEGEYRIRFIYSTESNDASAWRMDPPKHGQGESANQKLLELLKQVPKATVCSNEITVKMVKPRKPMSTAVKD